MDRYQPDWQKASEKVGIPDWLDSITECLADDLIIRMNSATVVSPNAFISLGLLSSEQRAMPERDLIGLLASLIQLQREFPYSDQVSFPENHFENYILQAEKLESFSRFHHAGGDVLYLSDIEAVRATYYSNNILHLLALPSLVARFFAYNSKVSEQEVLEGCAELYPFLKHEFFLIWPEKGIQDVVRDLLIAMTKLNLLQSSTDGSTFQRPEMGSGEYGYLMNLSRTLGLVFERYTITIALLAKYAHRGYVETDLFSLQCQKMAQRIAILNGLHSPESIEKTLFNRYMDILKRLQYFSIDKDRLFVHKKILNLSQKSRIILSPDTLHSIERITTESR